MMNANFFEISKRILPRLSNYEWHKDEVSIISDLVVTYYVDDEPITTENLDIWNISSDELYDIAVGNIKTTTPEITTPYGVMSVITNSKYKYGAVSVLDYEFMERAMTAMRSDKLRLIPSSVHEWIIVGDWGELDNETLSDMIEDVNTSQVDPKERLGNHVYRYTLSNGLEAES